MKPRPYVLLLLTAGACALMGHAADPSVVPAAISDSLQPGIVVVAKGSPEHPRNSEGGIVELRDGSWLQVWSEWNRSPDSGHDYGSSHIVQALSHDQGRTWQDQRVLVENHAGDLNVMPASILRISTGEILLEYQRNHNRSSTSGFVQVSRDEGVSWSPPIPVWGPSKGTYILAANSTLMQMSTGRILLPVTLVRGEVWGREEHDVAGIYWSDDQGRTWLKGDVELDLPMQGAMEPTVAERPDGSALMVLRSELGSIFSSESPDGIHWSLPQTLGIRTPLSRIAVARIPHSPDMVLAWNNSLYDPKSRNGHFGLRTPLTVAISRDGGRTWGNFKAVEAAPDYEYTNIGIAFTSQGKMVLSYMASRTRADGSFGRTAIDLRNAIVPLEWLYQP